MIEEEQGIESHIPHNPDLLSIIPTSRYKELKLKYNFSGEEEKKLKKKLTEQPEFGKLVSYPGLNFKGTGLYKIHVPINNGPHDGRLIYAYYPNFTRIYLLVIYSKSQDKDLSKTQYKKLIERSIEQQEILEKNNKRR